MFIYVTSTGYLALNIKNAKHCAHTLYTLAYVTGYFINYGFRLLLSAQGLFLLLAGSLFVTIPPYLVAEWLSNRRSFTQCLVLPESDHDDK